MRTRWNGVWAALAVLGLVSSVQAQDAVDPEAGEGGEVEVGSDDAAVADADGGSDGAKPVSVGLLLGYGISLEDGLNAWGLGFGVRGGYNIDQIFLGARFVYYLGESTDNELGGDATFNAWELGLEVGYDVALGGATVRPALGLGIENFSIDTGFGSGSDLYLYLAPGAALLFDVADNIFVGLDARFKVVFADPDVGKAIILLATGGMRF